MTTPYKITILHTCLIGICVMVLFCVNQTVFQLDIFQMHQAHALQSNDITPIHCLSHTALDTCDKSFSYFKTNSIISRSVETSANHLG